jgi:hypothetical protein
MARSLAAILSLRADYWYEVRSSKLLSKSIHEGLIRGNWTEALP